jgi:MFS family permease
VALFGAEFLMPVYLQAFRGHTALQAGVILLAVAATAAIATPLAGRLYDKIGPRMIMVTGFAILCVNTWQLAQIQALTPISYIIFLLALRGLAIGLTLQTSFVTALGAIPLNQLPRGSSLLNSTRFVVQAVSVAALATILAGSLSADVRARQEQMQRSQTTLSAPFGVCETPGVAAQDNLPPGVPPETPDAAKAEIRTGLQQVCDESIQGFENAYRITFFASIGALLLAAFLPGWPGRWSGRGGAQAELPAEPERRAVRHL